jgi:hypothetical protein
MINSFSDDAKPKKKWTYVVAGTYEEYEQYVHEKVQEPKMGSNISRYGNYIYVSDGFLILSQKEKDYDMDVVYIGTYMDKNNISYVMEELERITGKAPPEPELPPIHLGHSVHSVHSVSDTKSHHNNPVKIIKSMD